MAAPICTFTACLEAGGPSFMPTQVVVVPLQVVEALGGKTTRRVAGTLNGYPVRLGLLPMKSGERLMMINKNICQAAGVQIGQQVTLTLNPDPTPDHVDLPDELAEALAAWPEAEAGFQTYNGSMRRAIAQHVGTAKQAETRARRAVELAERLAAGRHPFRK
ncbi:YdeI/OmpD-associated family protein [Hymenobacter sp. BT730]|uniref:YdeI/OmpD-associated family protein n=1 Tax=Hymenobacter sp. BT730 TaxID=3063332 RepID=UPI0026E09F46|nr:YdeI/OmpD-associated family protein [Hymenobacter sp. BT730]